MQLGVKGFGRVKSGITRAQATWRSNKGAADFRRIIEGVVNVQSIARMWRDGRKKSTLKIQEAKKEVESLIEAIKFTEGAMAEEEKYELLSRAIERAREVGVADDDSILVGGERTKKEMENLFEAMEDLLVASIGEDKEAIAAAIERAEELGVGVEDSKLVRGYRKLQDIEIKEAVAQVERAVEEGRDVDAIKQLIDEALMTGATEADEGVLVKARLYCDDLEKERRKVAKLKLVRAEVKKGRAMAKGGRGWESDLGDNWDETIRNCIANISSAMREVGGEEGDAGLEEAKQIIEKLERGREREKRRRDSITRRGKFVDRVRLVVGSMDSREVEEVAEMIERVRVPSGEENEKEEEGLKVLLKNLATTVEAQVEGVSEKREKAIFRDELVTVMNGAMWAVEDQVKRRLKNLENALDDEICIGGGEEERQHGAEGADNDQSRSRSDELNTIENGEEAESGQDNADIKLHKEVEEEEEEEKDGSRENNNFADSSKEKDVREDAVELTDSADHSSDRASGEDRKGFVVKTVGSGVVSNALEEAAKEAFRKTSAIKESREKVAMGLQKAVRRRIEDRVEGEKREETKKQVAATNIQKVFKGGKVRNAIDSRKERFKREPGQPEGEDVVGWEVRIMVETEEEDQNGAVQIVETWHSGHTSKYWGWKGKEEADEVQVTLYKNTENAELVAGGGGYKEVCKAGGSHIQYKVKRPIGPETYAAGGGWEVEVRVKTEADAQAEESGASEWLWARGYVSGYDPYDDTVKVQVYNDGDMTDILEGMVDAGDIEREEDHFEVTDASGDSVRYLRTRPEKMEEAVGMAARAYVEVDEDRDEGEEGEEAVHDWVNGKVTQVRASAEDEDELVYIIEEDGTRKEYECATGEGTDIQFV